MKMAKFVISGDTKTGEIMVQVDGQSIDNVAYACAENYKYDGENKVTFRAESQEKKDNGVNVRMSMYAKKLEDKNKVVKDFDDIVLVENNVDTEVVQFFASAKNNKKVK